jgi:hypothetical protein
VVVSEDLRKPRKLFIEGKERKVILGDLKGRPMCSLRSLRLLSASTERLLSVDRVGRWSPRVIFPAP